MNDKEFIAFAYALIGKPFASNGYGPDSFDCLGLSCFLAWHRGYRVAAFENYTCGTPQAWVRLAMELPDYLDEIDRSDLQTGDIVEIKAGLRLHLGTYLEYGRFIHADRPGVAVGNIRQRPYDQLIKRTFRIKEALRTHA